MKEAFDVIVIGSGPGGYVAAIRCAQLGLKTACVEKSPALGGTCLNIGCIPSKALLHSTEFLWKMQHEADSFGIRVKETELDFFSMMKRKQDVVQSFTQGISFLFQKNHIERFIGRGTLTSKTTVEVTSEREKKTLTASHIILATGSEPTALPFLPFDEKRVVSSTGALSLEAVPKKMVVIGAGVIGVELGSVYSRLGAEVIFLEFLPKICPLLDDALSKSFQQILEKQGMRFHLSTKVTAAKISPSSLCLTYEQGDKKQTQIEADVVLVAIGRRPYTDGLGLEKAGVETDNRGFVKIDTRFRTSSPNIYAIGDIVDGPMLAHKASEEGVACAELIAGLHPHVDYMTIPSVVYTYPEIAAVGFTEQEAKELGLSYKVGTFPFKTNSRARCTGEEEGFVKVLAEAKTGSLLGIHILGSHASELIASACIALDRRMTVDELASLPYAHPTLSEAIKEAALAAEKKAIHR